MKTGIREDLLLKRDSIKPISDLGMTHFSEGDAWIHFKNPIGLIYSVRRYLDDYPDLGPYFDVEGTPTGLPKGLVEAVALAEIFSMENADKGSNLVKVILKGNRLQIEGEGVSGKYRSRLKKVNYKGPDITFLIAPKLLVEITKKHNEVEIAEDRLKVDGGRWRYISYLFKADDEPVESDDSHETNGHAKVKKTSRAKVKAGIKDEEE